MAFIRKRGKTYSVVYYVVDSQGKKHQKSETFKTQKEAEKRRKEVDYKQAVGKFTVAHCTTVKDLINEYIKIYGRGKWTMSTYSGNISLINNYILPTIGKTKLSDINTHYMETYYQSLLEMPAVRSTRNTDGSAKIPEGVVRDIHKLLRSCFRQAVKWDMMEKNPTIDAIVPKVKKTERDIWTAEMLMNAIDASDDKIIKVGFHLAFAATLRIGELLALTWKDMDISEEAINENRAYIVVNKELVRVSKTAMEAVNPQDIILVFPTLRKNNTTVRVLKSPKTESSVRRVYIPKTVAKILLELKQEQEELKEILGDEYQDYDLVMATSFGLPLADSFLRNKMQQIIDKEGLPDVVFHSLRHTSVTYKLKLTGGDIKSVQGDSGHSQADMVTQVYSHIIDEERRKNAELMEKAFYNNEETDSKMKGDEANTIRVPEGVDPNLLKKILANPEMAALLTAFAQSMKD